MKVAMARHRHAADGWYPMPTVTVYTVPHCLDCAAVKNLLAQAGIPYREVDISRIPGGREALALLSGLRSVPQVFVGDRFIGQVFEVRHLIHTGRLQEMLAAEPETRPSPADPDPSPPPA